MSFSFNIERAAQLTAFCIHQEGGDRMNILKLMKLLYIADRKSLGLVGFPLTGDDPFALPHGPVPTRIFDLTKTAGPDSAFIDEDREEKYWCEHFRRDGRDLVITANPGEDRLSEHDRDVLSGVVNEHRGMDQFQVRDLTHEFPEWVNNNPGQSSKRIPLHDIFEAIGLEGAIEEARQTRREDRYFAKLFGA